MTRPRLRPYTSRGIKRVPCFRCGAPSRHQWNICALGPGFNAMCLDCDIALNRLVLEWTGLDDCHELADAYAVKARAEA